MSYLLDTSACIAVINARPPMVRERLVAAFDGGEEVALSTVVAFELWYGVAKSTRIASNKTALERFLAPCIMHDFDSEDAKVAGDLRAQLEKSGRPIGAYDLLIAAQAVRRDLTLVTANVREFSRVRGLAWENWGAARRQLPLRPRSPNRSKDSSHFL